MVLKPWWQRVGWLALAIALTAIDGSVVFAQEGAAMVADVLNVSVSGNPGSYTFSVTIASPDTGCDRYADWWEVLTPEGELLYRRVLLHSHVSEQPFARSGGPVAIAGDREVLVRAHMHPDGYGGQAMRGTSESEWEAVESAAEFAAVLEKQPPLPQNCAF
ncbi:hypothetical protein [Synechococcus sp. PCC 7336]|uniref:hypothetical protein n=1 Tax=Synechococcus sp. PCC 7336 TaxID=195250 RepID=UPI00034C7F5E|nr:hypothetical protein [Synechococcus sp. PCC 7336]